MVNIFPGLTMVLAGWIVAVSGLWAGGGRVSRANWRPTPSYSAIPGLQHDSRYELGRLDDEDRKQ